MIREVAERLHLGHWKSFALHLVIGHRAAWEDWASSILRNPDALPWLKERREIEARPLTPAPLPLN